MPAVHGAGRQPLRLNRLQTSGDTLQGNAHPTSSGSVTCRCTGSDCTQKGQGVAAGVSLRKSRGPYAAAEAQGVLGSALMSHLHSCRKRAQALDWSPPCSACRKLGAGPHGAPWHQLRLRHHKRWCQQRVVLHVSGQTSGQQQLVPGGCAALPPAGRPASPSLSRSHSEKDFLASWRTSCDLDSLTMVGKRCRWARKHSWKVWSGQGPPNAKRVRQAGGGRAAGRPATHPRRGRLYIDELDICSG